MAVATSPYTEKTDEQKAITEMVRQFVDEQVIPIAEEYDHEDKFPEAGLGSDVQAISTSAKKEDDHYVINGQKMWVTNGLMSGVVFLLAKTDREADPPYKGMTCFICEKEPGASENTGDHAGLNVPPKIKKMGYKGVESTELVFDGYRCPAENILGGEEAGLNKGFGQMMDALEVGRVNVAARGVGIAQRALELALRYSQE